MGEVIGRSRPDSLTAKIVRGRPPEIAVLGVSFKSAPISKREEIFRNLIPFQGSPPPAPSTVRERALLSTCNRIELYVVTEAPEELFKQTAELFEGNSPSSNDSKTFFQYRGREAVAHLFEVAAGLDSIVVGEPQILGQVRSAGISARKSGAAKGVLSPLFDRAYRVGKKARERYRLDPGEYSLSSLAVEAATTLGPTDASVLLIGTGKMVQLAASRLGGIGRQIYVATRRKSLPEKLSNSRAIRRKDIPRFARKCGVIISATVTRRPILEPRHLRGSRKKLIVDLGMPRNVSPTVARMKGVRLMNLDDLARLARTRSPPQNFVKAIDNARQEAEEFYGWLVQTRMNSTLSDMHRWAARVREEEFARAASKLKLEDLRDLRILDAMGRRVAGKLMSRPTAFARRRIEGLPEEAKLEILRSIYSEEVDGVE